MSCALPLSILPYAKKLSEEDRVWFSTQSDLSICRATFVNGWEAEFLTLANAGYEICYKVE